MRPAPYSGTLPLAIGFLALALLLGGVGYWSVEARIAGAVIADGVVVVEHNRQAVQHPEGGVVGAILARDGDRVRKGETLIRLDDAALRSELAVTSLQLVELAAQKARLTAERDGAAKVAYQRDLASAGSAALEQIEGQNALFEARRRTLGEELAQIGERILQSEKQIEGTAAQMGALTRQAELIAADLADQETLLAKGLTQAPRVSALRRETARLEGEIGAHAAHIARLKGQIAALETEKLKLAAARREDAIAALRDISVNRLELAETEARLTDRLSRLEIRAPVSGIVYGATVFAERSVVTAAETLMFIVPEDQPLIVAARAPVNHVDQIRVGQPATLRFSAFNPRRTPDVEGRVVAVSADALRDEATGAAYYRIDVIPDPDGLAILEARTLMPGMPVVAFLKTDMRSPLSYLTAPLTDYFSRAMREG